MDTRFSGYVTVEPAVMLDTVPVVRVETNGLELAFLPDEARRLATALLEAAAATEKPAASDDAWLDEVTC
ncbi:hypothetical protein HQQ80_07010 [Microbacteriaceae bacterium VKM Ac-2855]|nr:hypothetical protein [Microbacteriaceae bacterium VKM Ac-2855]